jgi:hypothetical protein
MAKKIKTSDLIDPNFLDDPIKQSETFLKVIKGIKEEFQEVLKISKQQVQENPLKSFEDADKLAKEVDKINLATKELNKLEDQRLKLEKQLLATQKEDVKQKTAIKLQIQENNKVTKDSIKLAQAEKGSIEQLRAQNKLLLNERNKLNVNTVAGQQRLKELNKELDLNNKIIKENVSGYEKQKINIGNYSESVKQALQETGIFSGALGGLAGAQSVLSTSFKGIKEDIKSTANEFKTAQGVTSKFTSGVKLAGTALKASGIALGLAALTGVVGFFTQFEEGVDTLEAFKESASIIIKDLLRTFKEFFFNLGRLPEFLGNSFKKLGLIIQKNLLEILDNIPYVDNTEKIKELDAKIKDLDTNDLGNLFDSFDGLTDRISKAIDQGREIVNLRDEIAKKTRLLSIENEKLSASEQILSLRANDATLSFKERQKASEALEDVENKRIQSNLLLAEQELEANIRIQSIKTGATQQAIREALRSQEAQGVITDKILEELTVFQLNVSKLENEARAEREKVDAINREIEQKQLLNRINILRDFTSIEIALNEKRTEALKGQFDLQRVLIDTRLKLSEDAYNEEIRLLQEKTPEFIDAQKLLTIQSATELEQTIDGLGLSDKLSKLLIDVINDRKKALEDINGSLEKVNASADEAIKKRLEAQEKFKKGQLDETDFVKRQADLVAKRLKQEQDLKNAILDTAKLTLDKINERKQAEIEALDVVINKRKENVDRQQELAEKGLTNQLAFEQQKLDEAEVEKARLQREQEKREKRIAYYKAFSSALENSKNTGKFGSAAVEALAQVLIADTIAGAFKDGVENLHGEGTSTSDSIIARLSKGESVITAKGTKDFAGLPTAINNGEGKEWIYKNIVPTLLANENKDIKIVTDSKLITEIQDLKKVIKNKTEINVNWNSLDERVESLVKDGMIKTVKHIRKRPRI